MGRACPITTPNTTRRSTPAHRATSAAGLIRVLAVHLRAAHGRGGHRGLLARRPESRPGGRLPRRCCAIVVPIVMARLDRADPARRAASRGRAGATRRPVRPGATGLARRRADRISATIARSRRSCSRQLEQATRHGTTLALLLVDVDDLKKVNDERGHANGDELLAGLGRITTNAIRRGDRAFRVGGDEFAVILPNADIETGLVVARRMLASALNGGYAGERAGRALLAVDRDLRVSRPQHPGQPALPPRGRGAVLVQATWTHECGRLRPGTPRRLAGRALHRGRLGGARARSWPSGRSDPSTSRSSR